MVSNSGMPLVEWLIAIGMVVVVPLGLRLGSAAARSPLWALTTGAVAVSALFVSDATWSAALVAPYLLVCVVLAVLALQRLLARSLGPESLVDLAQVELPIAAAWLLASRAGWSWGFEAPIVALTSAHFHYAGFAAATIAGVVLRRQWAPWTATAVALGPPLVGLGIALSPVVEVTSAVTLAAGMLGLAVAMVRSDRWLALPALPLLGTMTLAVVWAVQELLEAHWLVLPQMAQWHGAANALGFGLLGLLVLQIRGAPVSEPVPPRLPMPDVRPTAGVAPLGLYPSLAPFGLERVPAAVARYHLDSGSVVLLVRGEWAFKWLGTLVNRVGLALGNLALPAPGQVARVTNTLEPMAPGWVHSTRRTQDGQVMFRLGYGTHDGRMRVVAPLPLGALDALLVGEGTDPHTLTTERIHYTLGPLRVRLPMREQLVGWVHTGQFLATQTFSVAGVRLVRMDYVIGPTPDPALLARAAAGPDPAPA